MRYRYARGDAGIAGGTNVDTYVNPYRRLCVGEWDAAVAIFFPYTVGSNPLTVGSNIALMVGSKFSIVCKLQTGLLFLNIVLNAFCPNPPFVGTCARSSYVPIKG